MIVIKKILLWLWRNQKYIILAYNFIKQLGVFKKFNSKAMSEEKGLLLKKHQNWLAKIADEAFKAKNPIIEAVDGVAFKIIIGLVDDNLADKIPDKIKLPLRDSIGLAMDGNYEEAETKLTEFINNQVDIPGVDEESEQYLFKGLVHLVTGLIKKLIEKKKSE